MLFNGTRFSNLYTSEKRKAQELKARGKKVCVCLLLQDLVQSCLRGGEGILEDMCYERRRAEAFVEQSAHHALVNTGEREIVETKEGVCVWGGDIGGHVLRETTKLRRKTLRCC